MKPASGFAAWPGPPASASTALELGVRPACSRSTLSPIVPGTVPPRSRGTVTVVQAKAASWGQGVKLREVVALVPGEAAEEAGQPASGRADRRATKTESGARTRIGTDNSGTRRGAPRVQVHPPAPQFADERLARPEAQGAAGCRGAADSQRDASGLQRAGDRHARHVGVAVEAQPAFGELRPAGAQAAGVQRGGDDARGPARPARCFEQL